MFLFDTVVDYCHRQYSSSVCDDCNHHSGCPGMPCGNCKQCFEEVHYPSKYIHGRKDYECERMTYFYVCDYMAKYASEMLYLMRKSSVFSEIEEYRTVSIGCGACPDLMAMERYCYESSPTKTVSYLGIDVNRRWANIHEKINTYRTAIIKNTQFRRFDAVTQHFSVPDANVIVFQYLISHFYNNNQIGQIDSFFQKIVDEIITCKQKDAPMVILINDVNSVYRGRDCFMGLINMLSATGLRVIYKKFYFDYNIKNEAQKYGEKHDFQGTIFELPEEFESIYQPWHVCSSAQLLIEIQ